MIIAVFGSARPVEGDALYEDARRLGALLAQQGHTLMTGGYCGLMEAVSRGAAEAGGSTIGVTCAEIERHRPGSANPWVQVNIRTQTLNQRLEVLTRQPDAMIALPGGIGTLTELSLALNLSVISANSAKPIVLLGPVWRAVLENFYIQNDGLTSQEDLARVRFCLTPEEAAEFFHNNTNRK
ncbi:MAG: LOG family protein [Anaerolineaceae bacterium]